MPLDGGLDWQLAKLGEIARSFAGGTPARTKPEYYGPGVPWLKSGEVRAGRIERTEETITAAALKDSAARLAKAGTPVIAMYGATAGIAGILGIDAALNQAVLAVEPRPGVLDAEFCYRLLQTHTARLLELTQGSGQPNLSKTLIDGLEVMLPPLDEQRRIAEVLRSVDEAIAASEAVEAQAFRTLKQTMLASLHLDGEAERHGWRAARICDLGKVQAGRQRAPSFTEGEVRPYLRVANVFDGFIDTSDVLAMPFTQREYDEYRLLPGDILLNEGQSIDLVGRAAMYLGDPEDCCFQNTIVRFRASVVPPSFAYALIRTLYWTGRLSAIASRTTSVAHLGVARFANIQVPVPPPHEQVRLGELFSDLCAAQTAHQAASRRLVEVRRSLSTELLSGRVRVPV